MDRGSIRKQGDGSWQIRFCLGRDPLTKKYIRKQFTYHTTPGKTEKEQLKEVGIEKARLMVLLYGDDSYSPQSKITIKDYLQKWLTDHVEANLKKSTIRWYKMLCNRHIIPNIGAVKLDKITALTLQELFTQLKKQGASDYTLKDVKICLNSAFEIAIEWGYIKENPLSELKRFTKELNKRIKVQIKQSHKTWNIDEAITLIRESKNTNRHIIYLLALTNGLRRGEIAGLKWRDINLEEKTVHIQQALVENEEGDTKTLYSDRILLLADFTIEELKRIKDKQIQDKERAKHLYKDNGFIIANAIGEPIHPDTISHKFVDDINGLGLPRIRFHDLRHTSASLLYEYFEISLDIVSKMLGHSSLAFTQSTYTHTSHELFRESMEKVNEELKRRLK
jgi:integrase